MTSSKHINNIIKAISHLVDSEREEPFTTEEWEYTEFQKKHYEETGVHLVNPDWTGITLKPAIQIAFDLFRSSELYVFDQHWAHANSLDPLNNVDHKNNYLDPKYIKPIQNFTFEECKRLFCYYAIRGDTDISNALKFGLVDQLLTRMRELNKI